ncbi:MAG TPA: biopolymer transporter ExbD [Planctomycetota bacterium]|nr:biopolymer transporter ExbD [Planctomycetota bacterium]
MLFARRRGRPPEVEQDGFDMTPMIDCTFQLIIFFILVTDMSRVQTEAMTLPTARGVDPKEAGLVVNVMPDGKIRIDGRTVKDEALESIFEGRRARAERGSGYPVILRADRSTPFEHVQKVMMVATTHGAVTRIQFCAKKE